MQQETSTIDDVEVISSPESTSENKSSPLKKLNGAIIPKRHKWLGGIMDPSSGKIYGVPAHAHSIICVDTSSATSSTPPVLLGHLLPPKYRKGRYKWLRGVITPYHLYCLPAWGPGVLQMNLTTLEINVLPLPDEPMPSRWKWHGGSLSDDGSAIYCIPANASRVMKIDTETFRCSYIGPSFPLTNSNKWYGGIKGVDGAIYGMPYKSSSVLRIDPSTDIVETLGEFGEGLYNWHGGTLSDVSGAIYAFPSHASEVLKIDTTVTPATLSRLTLDTSRTPGLDLATRYKWGGGAIGADGAVYAMPSDADCLLRIDPLTDEVVTFGTIPSIKNKWQNGVLAPDGWIYAIPGDATNVLRIDTRPTAPGEDWNADGRVELIGELSDLGDKWQGGFLGKDGNIWVVPENADEILKIVPDGNNCRLELVEYSRDIIP